MNVLDILKEEGKQEGKQEGEALGATKAILSLCKSRLLSSIQAREQLEKLATTGEISQEKLREALAQLSKI